MFTKYYEKNYYCELFLGNKDKATIHERNLHKLKDKIVECHCPVCKK